MDWGDAFKAAWKKATEAARQKAATLAVDAKEKSISYLKKKALETAEDWGEKKKQEAIEWANKKTAEVAEWSKQKTTQSLDWLEEKAIEVAPSWAKDGIQEAAIWAKDKSHNIIDENKNQAQQFFTKKIEDAYENVKKEFKNALFGAKSGEKIDWGDAFKAAWKKATEAARQKAATLAVDAKKAITDNIKNKALKKAEDWAENKKKEAIEWAKKKIAEVAEWAKKKGTQVASWGNEKYAEAKDWTKETATNAWEATKKGVSKITSPMANWVRDKYRKIKNIFGNKVAGNPVTSCSKGQLTQPNPLSTGEKVTAAIAALGTTAYSAYEGYKDGGSIGAAFSALDQLSELEGKLPNAKEKSLDEKVRAKIIVSLPKLVKQIPALYKMGLSYKATGYLNIAKGNLLNVHPGRYKLWTPLKTMQLLATTTGLKMLGKAGAIGGIMEMGWEVFKYATDPTKSFELEFANYLSKAGVKGVTKGVVGTIVTGKATAAGAAIGTMICPGIGTVIGGGVGFIAGVAASVAADELIDKAIDWTWEKAGEGAKYVGDKAKQTAKYVGDTAESVWNGTKNVAKWATSWW